MRAIRLCAVTVLLLTLTSPARADDGQIGGVSGSVHVVANDDIRMESETVQVIVYQKMAEVVADFRFVNSGKAQDVRLGFPFLLAEVPAGEGPPMSTAAFRAWKDGEELDVRVVRGKDGPMDVGYYEHSARFGPGVSHVRVSYLACPGSYAGTSDEAGLVAPPPFQGLANYSGSYDYLLHTGAGWRGSIGRAVVRFTASEDFEGWGFGESFQSLPVEPYPRGFTRPDPRTIQWVFEDFEPVLDEEHYLSPYDLSVWCWFTTYGPYFEDPLPPNAAQPPVLAASVSSSAEPPPKDALLPDEQPAYDLWDGDPTTAWLSAAGKTSGEKLEFTFGTARNVRELRVVGGWPRTAEDYAAHGRPKRISVRFSNGNVVDVPLKDEPGVQRIPLANRGNGATVTIEEVYPGTAGDVAIAEIEFGAMPAPEILSSAAALSLPGEPIPNATVAEPPLDLSSQAAATVARRQRRTTSADVPSPLWESDLWQGIVVTLLLAGLLVTGTILGNREPSADRAR